MRKETITPLPLRNVPGHTETRPGNVPELRMFHVQAVRYVPLAFYVHVPAPDEAEACRLALDLVRRNEIACSYLWDHMTVPHVHGLYELGERSTVTWRNVPERFRVSAELR